MNLEKNRLLLKNYCEPHGSSIASNSKVTITQLMNKMSTSKKVVDFLYRGFSLSMVTLTVYGGVVLVSRFYNMMEERKIRQKNIVADVAILDIAEPAAQTGAAAATST